jgi:hypothetical protein
MERAGEHRVPAGPLAVRWRAFELPRLRAGATHSVRVVLANEGSAPWRGLRLAYHWLDDRGNPIVWDGRRTELPETAPGNELEVEATVQAPLPPGRYRLAFDLVLEHRFWLSEVGNALLELDVPVEPRIGRALAVQGAQVDRQEEPLVALEDAEAVAYLTPACEPAPDWSARVLDTHQEGYAVVGGSIHAGRAAELAPYRETGGRNPSFGHPLVCPSLVTAAAGRWVDDVAGLPAFEPAEGEPSIYDGRIRIKIHGGNSRFPP